MNKTSNAYKKAKIETNKTYGTKTSAYRSAYLVAKYLEYGGTKPKYHKSGLERWFKEKWIQIGPYLKNKSKIPCGQGTHKKACRPLFRITKQTPITLPELIKKHGKSWVQKKQQEKIKYPNQRIKWKV